MNRNTLLAGIRFEQEPAKRKKNESMSNSLMIHPSASPVVTRAQTAGAASNTQSTPPPILSIKIGERKVAKHMHAPSNPFVTRPTPIGYIGKLGQSYIA